MEKSLTVFEKFVRSEETRKTYRYFMGRFLKWRKANVEPMITADVLMTLKEEALQTYVEDFLFSLRTKISPNSYQPIIAWLELYFSMNSKKLD